MSGFKVGDPVECLLFGAGMVTWVYPNGHYPVEVKFDSLDDLQLYTIDGRLYTYSNITLTKKRWEVKEVLPEVTFEEGELVWVDLLDGYGWQVWRYEKKELHYTYLNTPTGKTMRTRRCIGNGTYLRKFKDNPYEIND